MIKLCKGCSCKLPNKRIELGYDKCVECSDVEKVGAVDIVVHKTGNYLQFLPKSQADAINKTALRKGFGSHLSNGKDRADSFCKRELEYGASTAVIGSQAMFNRVLEEVLLKLDILGFDKALDYLNRKLNGATINASQHKKIKDMIEYMHNGPQPEQIKKKVYYVK